MSAADWLEDASQPSRVYLFASPLPLHARLFTLGDMSRDEASLLRDNVITVQQAYEEACQSYRHYTNWRQIAAGGYFVVLYGCGEVFAVLRENGVALDPWHFIVLAFIASLFWIFDDRSAALFRCAIEVARRMEEDAGVLGFYSAQQSLATLAVDKKRLIHLSHTLAATLLYGGSLLSFLAIALWMALSTG